MNIDFTQLIIAILGIFFTLFGGLCTKYVVPWLREKGLDNLAIKLVSLAWSIFEDGQGKAKFDYVCKQLADKYGKWFDTDEIAAATQAAYIEFCAKRGIQPSR